MTGGFAFFALLISLFIKIFPVMSVWEVAESYEEEETAAMIAAHGVATEPAGGAR